MRPLAVLLLSLAALAAAPALAQAKEIAKVEVCGPAGCVPVDRSQNGDFMDGGLAAAAPTTQAPWYRIRYTVKPGPGEDMEPFTFKNVYVPGAGLLRADGDWYEAPAAMAAAVAPLMKRVDPFPAASLAGVEVPQPAPAQPAAVASSSSSSPWPWIAGAAAVVLLALAVVLGLRRRRLPPRGSLAT